MLFLFGFLNSILFWLVKKIDLKNVYKEISIKYIKPLPLSNIKMDLKQIKLSKSEWDSIEIPVASQEKEVLELIIKGYSDVNIKINKTDSLFTFLKIEFSSEIEEFLYNKYFAEKVKTIVAKQEFAFIKFEKAKVKKDRKQVSKVEGGGLDEDSICYINIGSDVKLKTKDQIRLSRSEHIDTMNTNIYEFVLFRHFEQMITEKSSNNKHWLFHYYTLSNLINNNIEHINIHLKRIIVAVLEHYENANEIDLGYIIENSYDFIERNSNLLKYSDLTLYDHQKEIFNSVKSKQPKLVLYIAPTGTGKTLTPLGLSEGHRVIFVCAARHVGLALARSAISANKKIAFAFGCSSAEDIRLHYFAAKEYTVNKRTGAIKKVDNSVGDKVEIMICDIRSYLPAMYYMLAFNRAERIVVQWDEPTITMDYKDHALHKIIKKNWSDNMIPNMVLSSATLPKEHELVQTIADFKARFKASRVFNIVSHDCKKTIPLIDNNGYVIMPHHLSDKYDEVLKVVNHCEEHLTLLRYFDLKETSEFAMYSERNNYVKTAAKFSRNFANVSDINMKSIKLYYLKVLKNILPDSWASVYTAFQLGRKQRIVPNTSIDPSGNKILKTRSLGAVTEAKNMNSSMSGASLTRMASTQVTTSSATSSSTTATSTQTKGSCAIYVTTKDAYTLTDGPTIFLANDVQKVAKFCIQQANIPASIMKDIMEKIEFNNTLNERITEIESDLAFEEEKITNKLCGASGVSKSMEKKNKNKSKIASDMIDKTDDANIVKMRDTLEDLKKMVKSATLNDVFIPNKLAHLAVWAENVNTNTKNAFTSNIDEATISSIMLLKDVEDSWKVLLLLGIGVFTEHKSIAYTEIMKKLADRQLLYLIIADTDYIYGTNYQFCHGYLSKDLNMTQEKIIQALGRIGRNNIQQEYSARFRDDAQIKTLFTSFKSEDKPEVLNMNILFNTANVKWDGSEYVEVVNVSESEIVLDDCIVEDCESDDESDDE
jgi:hypothetical protein